VIEKNGIPTVSISTLEEVSRKVRPPRVVVRDVELGHPLGEADDAEGQIRVIRRVLPVARERSDAPRFIAYDALP